MKTFRLLLGATALFVLGSAPQIARAQVPEYCMATYTDFAVDTAEYEIEAWAWVADYFSGGFCGQLAYYQWGYWEHSYEAAVSIVSPTQRLAYDDDYWANVPYGGGSAEVFASLSYIDDPGEYDIEWILRIFCSVGGGGYVVDYFFGQPVQSPPCAVPTNFQQTNTSENPDGILNFTYTWGSSTGNMADLSACRVGETIYYPGGPPGYTPANPPWDNHSYAGLLNPTEIDFPATPGFINDVHDNLAPFTKPYTSASFNATQYYQYICPCANGGSPVNLMGPLTIARSVTNSGSDWTYSITKPTGGSASQTLPP